MQFRLDIATQKDAISVVARLVLRNSGMESPSLVLLLIAINVIECFRSQLVNFELANVCESI